MSFLSGIGVRISEAEEMLSIVISGSNKSISGNTKGLYGTWNGNLDDDFTLPDGTVLSSTMNGSQIHYDFGLSWQIKQEESLFTYKNGEGVANFSDPNFVPVFADEIIVTAEAKDLCGDNAECLFDFMSTGNKKVGEATKGTATQLEKDSKENSNTPPKFTGAPVPFNVTIHEPFSKELCGEDKDGDTFNIKVDKLPQGASADFKNACISFTWTPTSNQSVPLDFIITDSVGASSKYRPIIDMCACMNNGTCVDSLGDQDGPPVSTTEKFRLKPCKCTEGLSGKLCESDIDACAENFEPCYPGVKCIDKPAPANRSAYECGPCPKGYQGDGKLCEDIDECLNKTSTTCKQICINTPGSYKCDCREGYILEADKISCQDINECETGHDCMHKCTNTIGGYDCSCNKYFKLDSDNKRCIPENACTGGVNSCDHICYMAGADKKCSCKMGYELYQETKCRDIDECEKGTHRCDGTCTDTDGGYKCSCPKGFVLKNKYTCEDINECLELQFDCPESMGCTNIRGSYKCECLGDDIYYINGTCRALGKDEKQPPPEPPPKPKSPTEEEKEAAVKLTAKEMKESEWTKKVDMKFKEVIAESVTSFCRTHKVECSLESKARRKRRSATVIQFSAYDVHLLPGYPEESGSDLLLAVYVNLPDGVNSDKNVISQDTLRTILDGSLADVSTALNKKVIFTPPDSPAEKDEETNVGLIVGLVFACLAGIVIIAAIIYFCYMKSLQKKSGKVTFAMEEKAPEEDDLS